jgi:PLD-like domain
MPRANAPLVKGTSIDLDIPQSGATYDGLVDVGFTRNFASSQAYREQFGNNDRIIPVDSKDGLSFKKLDLKNDRGESVYDWLGFEAKYLLFNFLDEAIANPNITVDALAYDLNEVDIVRKLEALGNRLRIVIDDSAEHEGSGSSESKSAKRLRSAGAEVERTHFHGLQHHKVFIQRKNGVAQKVLCGSTNFTYRGLYIQSNNILIFSSAGIAGLFGTMFEMALKSPLKFRASDFAKKWHSIPSTSGPTIQVCFSPHAETDLSLNPIAGAIDQATSSALYSVAFLSQMKSGPTFNAFNRLIKRPIFSCGTVDSRGKLELVKPDGSRGIVDFKYLSEKAPEPFRSEWAGGQGRNIHHKFLVTDFNLPTAKVFTGSSNFSPSGENKNSDHLIMIQDRKIATAYAIEAIRVFDHLHFRNRMQEAFGPKGKKLKKTKAPVAITLKMPTAISGKPTWFEKFFVEDSQAKRDRMLFSK